MQQIQCPWCGTRDETEFTSAGELVRRPLDALAASDQEWTDYLYFRTNTLGEHTEVWRHTHGCRQWFKVDRDTVTHTVSNTRSIEEQLVEEVVLYGRN